MTTHAIAMHGTQVSTRMPLTCIIQLIKTQSTIVKAMHAVHSNSRINYHGNVLKVHV